MESLRLWFYRAVEPLAPACFQVYRRGDLLGRIIADIDLLDNLYLRMVAPALIVIMLAGLTTGGLGWFHPAIGVAAGGALLVSAIALVLMAAKGGASRGMRLNSAVTELRNDLVEGLQGLAEVLVYRGARPFQAGIARRQARMLSLQAGLNRLNALTLALATLAGGLTAAGVLYLGVNLVGKGMLDGAVLGLMVLATLASFEALLPLPGAFRQLGQTRAAAIARTAVPHPMSATGNGRSPAMTSRSSARRQPSVVPWCPVPKAIAASIRRGSASAGTLSASWLP